MRLLPKTKDFFDELGRHVANMVEASRLLHENAQTGSDLGPCARRIKELERDCDEITHQVILELHRTFITPLDRLNTHDIVSRLDDVMDALEQSAYCLARYRVSQKLPREALEMVELVKRAIELVARGVEPLKDLKRAEEILGVCRDIRETERRADEIARDTVARLFEDVRDAGTLLAWKEVYETLESVTDRCDDVADVLENIVLDNA